MMIGKTSFILVAIDLDIIFASTFTSEIGRRLSKKERSFLFDKCYDCLFLRASDGISPFSKHTFYIE